MNNPQKIATLLIGSVNSILLVCVLSMLVCMTVEITDSLRQLIEKMKVMEEIHA